jgi:hypothetical protein
VSALSPKSRIGLARFVEGRGHDRNIKVSDHAANAVFEQLAVIDSHAGSIADLLAAVEL